MFAHLEKTLERHEELERQMADSAVVSDPARYAQVAREHGQLDRLARSYRLLKELDAQIAAAKEMACADHDEELRALAEAELEQLAPRRAEAVKRLEELVVGQDAASHGSMIMEIRAGTGGDEAALFARDLFEMYKHLADRRGWKVEVLDGSPTELGGFKELIISISGSDAYRQLQFESGGHRVQRIPETETKGRRHTSLATVAVLPEPGEVDIEIRDQDLRIDTYRASGPGGQHVNKTSSAIRITHEPSGLVVQCQDEKSQHKNKAKAMRVLRSRLYEQQREQEASRRAAHRRTLIGSGDRSQRIRTYNFPENRVTDHRIGLTLYKLDAIVTGELDELIGAMLDYDRQQQLQAAAEYGRR